MVNYVQHTSHQVGGLFALKIHVFNKNTASRIFPPRCGFSAARGAPLQALEMIEEALERNKSKQPRRKIFGVVRHLPTGPWAVPHVLNEGFCFAIVD